MVELYSAAKILEFRTQATLFSNADPNLIREGFPLTTGNTSLLEDVKKQRLADVSLVGIGDRDLDYSARHALVSAT